MMEAYNVTNTLNLNKNMDILYSELLNKKYKFMIINCHTKKIYSNQKKSIIPVVNEKNFLDKFNDDIYYKTRIKNDIINVNENIYNVYVKQFKDKINKNEFEDGNNYYVKGNHDNITCISICS